MEQPTLPGMQATPKRRRGRPPLDPEHRPSVSVKVRVTQQEKEALEALASEQGLTVSDLIRGATKRLTTAGVTQDSLAVAS